MSDSIKEGKFTFAYSVIEHRLTQIWTAIDALDTKTNIILGFASVILVILAGLISVNQGKWHPGSLVLFGLATISYLVLVALSILSYKVTNWSYRPDPKTLLAHCQNENYSANDIEEWVIRECESACYENIKLAQRKARLTNWVIYLFSAETVLQVTAIACALISI
ncbi:MAG: hypothetical protein ABSA18_00995 [Dehalococcoidia bacterium]